MTQVRVVRGTPLHLAQRRFIMIDRRRSTRRTLRERDGVLWSATPPRSRLLMLQPVITADVFSLVLRHRPRTFFCALRCS